MLKIAEVTLIYLLILIILDYGSYFQATIFTTVDGSGRGVDSRFRNPPYHPLAHWSLLLLASMGLVIFIMDFGLNLSWPNYAVIESGLAASYFFARYLLMRKGIS